MDPNDPNAGQTDPGFLGQSPDFWRTIASLGGNTAVAANARGPGGFLTYGADGSGAIGAGVLGALDTQRQNRLTNSGLAYQAANTQDVQSQVQSRQLQNHWLGIQNQMRLNMMSDPSFLSGGSMPGAAPLAGSQGPSMMPSQAQGGQVAQPASATQPLGLRNNNPLNLKFAGQPGASTDGTFATFQDPADGVAAAIHQLQTYASRGINTLPAIVGTWAPKGDGNNNPAAYAQTVAQRTGLPMDKPLDMNDAVTVGKLVHGMGFVENGRPLDPQVVYSGLGKAGMLGGQPPASGTQFAGPGAPTGAASTPAPQAPGYPGMPAPQDAIANAQQMYRRAQQLELAGLPGADALKAQAQSLYQYGLNAQLQATKPESIRPGGGIRDQNGTITTIPAITDIPNGDGSTSKGAVTGGVVVNGQQAVPPSTSVLGTGQTTSNKAVDKEYGTKWASEGAKTYSAAQSTMGWTEQMDHAADALNAGGGWSSTGAGNNMRLELAKQANSLSDVFGIKDPFDPNKIASWEDLTKETKRAGMQLVNQNFGGSREAASIIQSAQSSVPNSENTPLGFKLVNQGIREGSQYIIDRRNYEAQHKDNLAQAGLDFDKLASPQMYTRRAISAVQPVAISDPKQFNRYLPGTRFIAKDDPSGQIRMVPERDGMPVQIPDYMQTLQIPTQAAQPPATKAPAPNSIVPTD